MIPKFRLHYQRYLIKYYTRILKVIPGGNLLILEPEPEIKPVHSFQHCTSVNGTQNSSTRIVHNGISYSKSEFFIKGHPVPGKNKGNINNLRQHPDKRYYH